MERRKHFEEYAKDIHGRSYPVLTGKDSFKYLGVFMNRTGRLNVEIEHRIKEARKPWTTIDFCQKI